MKNTSVNFIVYRTVTNYLFSTTFKFVTPISEYSTIPMPMTYITLDQGKIDTYRTYI